MTFAIRDGGQRPIRAKADIADRGRQPGSKAHRESEGRLTGAPASISAGSSTRAIIWFTGDSTLKEPPVKTAIRSRDGTRYTFWPPFPDSIIVSIRRSPADVCTRYQRRQIPRP